MIGVLLVSHGEMAEGMMDSMKLIVGDTESVDTAKLVAGQDFETLKMDIIQKIERLDSGKGVLVYVDLYGASPYNAAMFAHPVLKEKGIDTRVITGMNLPMILEIVLMRDTMSLDDIYKMSLDSGKASIIEGISEMSNQSVEEDGDY